MKYQLGDKQVTLLGSGHFIAPTAAVIGNVTLGERSSVWFSSVIRGDAERIEAVEGIGAELDPGTDLAQPVRLLENQDIKALARAGQGRRHAPDPAACDENWRGHGPGRGHSGPAKLFQQSRAHLGHQLPRHVRHGRRPVAQLAQLQRVRRLPDQLQRHDVLHLGDVIP